MSKTDFYPIIYPRYRGKYAAIPYPANPEQLEALAEERVKPGLEKLCELVADQGVDYLGYSFSLTHIDISQIRHRKTGGNGEDASWHEFNQQDDFYIGSQSLFRWMRKSGQTRCIPFNRDIPFGFPSIRQLDFVLGPVVCSKDSHAWYGTDKWGQEKDVTLAWGASVIVSGRVLMDALTQYNDQLREGFEVTPKQIADFFGDAYNMKAIQEFREPPTPYQGE